MEIWGLVLNGLGAILIAIGQEDVNRTIKLWLTALELTKETTTGGGDIINVRGVDKHMARSIKRNRIFSRTGWTLFVVGIVLQLIPHFCKAT
jgi:hypothetical protein